MPRVEVVVGSLEQRPWITLRNLRRSFFRGLLIGLPMAGLPLLAGSLDGALFVFILAQAVVPVAWVEMWATRWVRSTGTGLAAALLVTLVGAVALGLTLLQGLYAVNALSGGEANSLQSGIIQRLMSPEVLFAFFSLAPLGWLMGVASFGRLRGGFTQDGARVDSLALCLASGLFTFVLPMTLATPPLLMAGAGGKLLEVALYTFFVALLLVIPTYIGSAALFKAYGWADRVDARFWSPLKD
jgi:hypothetical protein